MERTLKNSSEETRNLEFKDLNVENKKYCRLCAKDQGSISIFDKNEQSFSYGEQINLCTQLEIKINDGLPSWLCIPCSQLLSSSFNFRQQCHTAQKELREIFQIFYDFKIEVQSDCEDFDNEDVVVADNDVENWEKLRNSKYENDQLEIKHEATGTGVKDYECMHKTGADNLESHLSCKGRDCWAIIFNKVNEDIVKKENEDENFYDMCLDVKDDSNDVGNSINDIKTKPLQDSYKVEIKDNIKVYSCPSCANDFTTSKQCKRHMKSNCKAKRDRARDVKKKKKVLKKEKISIKVNKAEYGSDVDESEHIKPSEENKQELFKCRHCGKAYKSGTLLQRHKGKYCRKNENIPRKTYMCDQCGSTFKQRNILKQHMARHTSKMFSCKLCEKRFTRGSHVAVHMRIHNNYKPYVCETCGHSFIKSSDLVRHKRIHSEARNYQCSLCTRTFKRSGDVTSHMRVHTGDRPYKCEPCSKSYSSQSSLRKHRRGNCPVKIGTGNSVSPIPDTKPPPPQATSVT